MDCDTIIIGQGIAGSMLSWFLRRGGQRVVVFDDGAETAATKVAIGTCNPITGVRFAKTWRVETLFPFARHTYAELEKTLNTRFCSPIRIYRAFPNEKLRTKWLRKAGHPEYAPYIEEISTGPRFSDCCHDPLGGIMLRGGFRVDTKKFLSAYRAFLQKNDALHQIRITAQDIRFENNGVRVGGVRGSRLILCTGAEAAFELPFSYLPFSVSKGEVVRFEADALELDTVFNKGVFILPESSGTFAAGASHDHEHIDTQVSAAGRAWLESGIRNAIRSPFRIIAQEAALRPTTRDRRPFVGMHPENACLGIFNGFGGKGLSVAPYFAEQFSRFLLHGRTGIDGDVSVQRWS
ncbi:MAG TPA: FAD-dependent oxidoreductase [Bacteroidetes bacterium]|nr:FAD-dependent oxidoreductase [Bacteroidota bacterium]